MRRGAVQRASAMVAVPALAAALSLALPAAAADGGDDDAAARAFREGRALLREGRVAEGCERMRESQALKRSPGHASTWRAAREIRAICWRRWRVSKPRATRLGPIRTR